MRAFLLACLLLVTANALPASADDGPDLIFKKTTVWKFLSPDH
jgi:CreA protein